MKVSYLLAVVAVSILLPVALLAQSAMPQMRTCEPLNAKIGDVVTVTGENLDKANVDKVYLTDGTDDFVVEIQDQAATAVKIKVPAKVKAGRLALMILTRGKEPKLIEQPVKLTIE
jgi:nitrous oxidase accessory protein NosD